MLKVISKVSKFCIALLSYFVSVLSDTASGKTLTFPSLLFSLRYNKLFKGKAIHVQVWTNPECFRGLRLPCCKIFGS
jgi:hypothetical protein